MNIDLLRRLCEMPGVPGREHRVRALIEAELEGLIDESYTDPMGSLLTLKKATKAGERDPLKIMLLCHMDEIGFLVSHVSDEGFVSVDPVGGFDPRNLFSRRVLVCTKDGDLKGVMNASGKPIHTASPEDRKKIPEPSEFFIDLGLGKAAKDQVRVGDYVVMDEPLIEIGEKVVSKALDNRIACWLGIEVLRALKESGAEHACDIHVAFTAQEEVGLRGAKTASYAVKPDIGFGIDTTLAVDTPGVPNNARVTVQGDGFGLKVKDSSFIGDLDLIEEVEALAVEKGIKHQRCILARGGQDGAAAQQAAAGARAVGLVVGTRYIHTVTEMIHRDDLRAAKDILVAYLSER
ncbi:MAG: M20/M25/M40 family metallo-hydrolase [Pseudomonadota bacterium]